MTPIMIPRKNNRDPHRLRVAKSSAKKLGLPLGRPSKRRTTHPIGKSSGDNNEADKLSKSQPVKPLNSEGKIALIERIPVELIQKIFFLSMNLNLPRSSPIIASMLSSEHIFIELLTRAFEPSWEWDFRARAKQVTLPPNNVYPGDPKLQTAMLGCRFATLPRLMNTQEIWLRRALSDPVLNVKSRYPPVNPITTTEKDVTFVEYFKDFATNTDRIEENWSDIVDDFPKKWDGLLNINPDTEIPDCLLQGPWTSDMMKKLFWLARAKAKIDWVNSTSGEVALSGLRTAIKTGNLQALWILHWLGTSEHITFAFFLWAVENAGGDRSTFLPRLKTMYEGNNPEDNRMRRFDNL